MNGIENQSAKPKVVLLDVYNTLLDMTEVERKVNYLLDSKRGYLLWFELFMQYCFVDNCTAHFNDFSSIARATLQMTGQMLGRTVAEADANDLLERLKHLPVQDGVPKGLSCLADLNFRIAALTNSPERTVRERMERTGLISYFEKVLSAEQVKKYKPSGEVYQWAAQELQLEASEIILVSAHGWDIMGAAGAGMATAYLQQPKQLLYPLAPPPNFVAKSLVDLASQLEAVFKTHDPFLKGSGA